MKKRSLLTEVRQLQKIAGILRENKFYAPDYLLQVLKSQEAVDTLMKQFEEDHATEEDPEGDNARDYLLSIDNPEELMQVLKDYLPLSEDDNTGGMMKTDAEQDEMSDEEMFGDEPEDTWYRGDEDDTATDEKEPTKQDVAEPASLSGVQKKQAKLKALEDIKDALLMQLNSGQLKLDQYKKLSVDYQPTEEEERVLGTEKINIPQQIKKLRADIDAALGMTGDEEEPVA